MTPRDFAALLRAEGFDFFTGVPCSLLKGVISALEAGGDYIPETREDAALGLAAGAHLGGRRPVVLMQNSGLGVSLNALTSLHLLYQLPCLLVVSWRGHQGQDAPEHLIMGAASEALMAGIGLSWQAPGADTVARAVRWAAGVIRDKEVPAALLLAKGVLQ